MHLRGELREELLAHIVGTDWDSIETPDSSKVIVPSDTFASEALSWKELTFRPYAYESHVYEPKPLQTKNTQGKAHLC